MTSTETTSPTLTVRYADEGDPGYAGHVQDWGGGWVLEDPDGGWVADLDTDGTLRSVRAALTTAGVDARTITPVGGNVTGPRSPVEAHTYSDTWVVEP